MSLFTDASLVYVPSGVKDGKTYSIKPTDGSGDLTFSRGSDIEATRVAANGYIQKAQVNLLLRSNSFSTSPWESNTTNREATLTSGQTGYDGSSDAWLLLDTTGSGQHQIASGSLTLGGVYTSSVYAKAYSSSRYLGLAGFGLAGANEMPVFDLVNGTVDTGTTSTYFIDANIESVGSGWYRCSVTFKYTGTSQLSITLCDTATDNGLTGYVYTGTGTNGIYIQDAQLNYGLVAQTYQETTTAAVVSGITDNMPRLNYDPANPTCPSLLLEPSRQNLLTHSDFIGAYTTISGGTFTTNYGISPEGVQNATRFLKSSGSRGGKFTTIAVSSGTTYTISMYVKSLSGTQKIRIGADNGCSTPQGAETFSVGETWTRISKTLTSTQTSWNVFFDNVESGTACTGTYLAVDMLIYGFQCEAGSYPSSLIPTYGSSATRTADACSKTGISSLIGQTEGTLFVEIAALANDVTLRNITITDGTTSNRIALLYSSTSNSIRAFIQDSGVIVFDTTQIVSDILASNKICIKYKLNDFALWINGVEVHTDFSGTVPTGLNSLQFHNGASALPFFGTAKQLLIFPTALTNAQLAELTA